MTDPNEFREQLKAQITTEFNEQVDKGDINHDKIPVANAAPVEPTAPAVTEPVVEAPTAPTPAPTPEGEVFGKYKDITEAEKGYFNMVTQARTVQDENDRLKKQLEQVSQPQPAPTVPGGLPGSEPRVNPAASTVVDWTKNDKVVRLAENAGLNTSEVADAFSSVVNETLATARQEMADQLKPVREQQSLAQADVFMQQKYPEASKFTQELGIFVEANPDVKAHATELWGEGKFDRAMEYSWLNFNAQRQNGVQQEITQNANETEANRVADRAAAGVTAGSPGTPIHAADPSLQAVDKGHVQKLVDDYGGGEQEAGRQLRRIVHKDVFDQLAARGFPVPRA